MTPRKVVRFRAFIGVVGDIDKRVVLEHTYQVKIGQVLMEKV